MQWDGYTVFSVLSGIALAIWALVDKSESGRGRAVMALVGIGMTGYGIYVAAQTSGTYYFSIWIFVLPFALVAKAIYNHYQRRNARGQS